MKYLFISIFVGLVVIANVLTNEVGLIDIWVTVPAGTFAAGMVLLVRDVVQEAEGIPTVVACIGFGTAVSALFSPQLAVASAVAFAASEMIDLVVYTPLKKRGWGRAAVTSNVAGAFVDSVLFLSIAGFPVWQTLPGQVVVKVLVTLPVIAGVVWLKGRERKLSYDQR